MLFIVTVRIVTTVAPSVLHPLRPPPSCISLVFHLFRRLRLVLAIVILGLISLDGFSRPGMTTSQVVSEALAGLAGLALLVQALLDQRKEQAVQVWGQLVLLVLVLVLVVVVLLVMVVVMVLVLVLLV